MKTALITGGTGAIGEAMVRLFAKEYEVVFTYLTNAETAKRLSEETGAAAVRCDISDGEQAKTLAAHAADCDVLINNAGISQIKLITDTTDDEWNKMIATNLSGVFYVTKAVLPSMIHNKCGSIINISSVWGVYGASCEAAYSAAKAGVIGFTKALAKEVGPSGITVNCIAPGVIESPMNAHLSDEEMQVLKDCTPLCRTGTPEEVAEAALYLAKARFVTGQILGVDGGFC